MKNKWSLLLASIIAYAIYLITMVKLPGYLDQLFGFWPEIFGYRFSQQFKDTTLLYFCFGHMAVFGAAVPLCIAKKFKLKPHRKVPSDILWTSIAALIGAFLFYAHYQGFLPNMLNPDPDPAYMTKAFIYIFPFSLGLCVYSCFLLPRSIMFMLDQNVFSPVLEALIAAGTMFLSWRIYTIAPHILSEKIFWTGMAIAAAGALSRSFYLSLIACFATLYGASMVNPVFHKIAWQPMLPGFLAAFAAFCLYLHSRDTRTFPPVPLK
ncbi:hypothetical protein [Maridesulfovibrio hydrothermalis]|uniref:Uncharacterized protein n=1 Tax=Maridesulfovibrio hydrothermalis AM13 = DSM 14728 TaxID=1121451 RepID=L0RF36_9BACT|nr:hypothetical protein [Maridesulfovibrio hydrothermalis]CCO25393.1 conserved membrane protein of unknown function [Maridesulfovibrio hydrothermalis AM13 = DSM 14728]